MLKSAKAGRNINLDDMPPPVFIKEADSSTKEATPTQEKPRPPQPVASKPPGNLIDLDDPELDEFNLTDEDLTTMAASFVDDRQQPQVQSGSKIPTSQSDTKTASPSNVDPKPTVSQSSSSASDTKISPPQPKPRPKPRPPPPSGGMIDLDDPSLDEFTLTEEELATMSSMIMDDRATKKPKLDDPSPIPVVSSEKIMSKSSSVFPSPQIRVDSPSKTQVTPSVSRTTAQSLPATLKKPVSSKSDASVIRSLLVERRNQYQSAAKSKRDSAKKKEFLLIAARFSRIVKAVDAGQEVDLSQMPGPPPGFESHFNVDVKSLSTPSPPQKLTAPSSSHQVDGAADEVVVSPDPGIPVPKTALEALDQRLSKYKEGMKIAQEKGESSRVRRMGRIIKQYELAIKDTKIGKPVDYDDLPAPPGYPPIPAAKQVKRAQPGATSLPLPTQSLPVSSKPVGQATPQQITPSISQQQIAMVERRMTELKLAAKQEQTKNNRDGALHYVKMMKGLESMLEMARNGLPVNLEQVPPSPFADLTKTKPSAEALSHLRPAEEKDTETFNLIVKQLEKQIRICEKNAETYKKMGSNASAIEYENMSQNCKRELLALKGIQSQGYGPPKFTLETRVFVIIHSNTHLSGSVCEVEVTRAIDLTRPPKYEEKDMSVYVEVEFPYPVDAVPKKMTEAVSKTCSPEFKDQQLVFDIDRKHHRSLIRAFKRSPLKCNVWQRRSLRKDLFIGEN